VPPLTPDITVVTPAFLPIESRGAGGIAGVAIAVRLGQPLGTSDYETERALMRRTGGVVTCGVTAVVGVAFAAAALAGQQEGEWTRFRGPNGSGVADVTGLPVEFGPETNVRWKQAIPEGQSSPVLGIEHVFITGIEGGALVVLALDRETGEPSWRRELEPGYEVEMYEANDAASPTPVTDGTNVYALFGDFGAVAFDGQGNELWRLELGPFDNFYGTAASPLLAGDTLILLFDQVRGSYLLGVDRHSGEVRWRRDRPGRVESWSTPVLYPSAEQPQQIIVVGSGFVDSYSVETGEPFWQLPGVGVLPVASPVLVGDVLLAASPDQGGYMTATFDALLAEGDHDGDAGLSPEELVGIEEMEVWISHFGYLDIDADGVLERAEYDEIVGTSETEDYGAVGIRLATDGGTDAEVIWREQGSVPYMVSPLVYQGLA